MWPLENNTESCHQPLKEKKSSFGAIAIEKEQCRINLKKPIYIGTSTLDISKVLMQDFQYNDIKNRYGDKAEILLTNTDSLISKMKVANVYKDF